LGERRDDEIIEKGDLRHYLLETWRYRDMNREIYLPSALVVEAERGAEGRAELFKWLLYG
jgi:hypothetical protein